MDLGNYFRQPSAGSRREERYTHAFGRILRLESLESRHLLSAGLPDLDQIAQQIAAIAEQAAWVTAEVQKLTESTHASHENGANAAFNSTHPAPQSTVTFTSTNAPEAPTLKSPGSGSGPGPILSESTETFRWQPVTGATSYGFYLRDLTTNTLIEDRTLPASQTSFARTLADGHQYRWNMRAFRGSTASDFSQRLHFRIDVPEPALVAPRLVRPGGAAGPGPMLEGTQQTLRWNAVPGATGYQLNVRDLTTNTLENYRLSGFTTSYSLTLTPGHAYRWNMFTYKGSTQSHVSETRYFTIQDTATPSISRVSPTHPQATDGRQNFTIHGRNFDGSAYVNLYDQVGTRYKLTGTRVLSRSGTQITVNPNFTSNGAGTWQVEMVNSSGRTSGRYSFQVKPAAATPSYPPTPSGSPDSDQLEQIAQQVAQIAEKVPTVLAEVKNLMMAKASDSRPSAPLNSPSPVPAAPAPSVPAPSVSPTSTQLNQIAQQVAAIAQKVPVVTAEVNSLTGAKGSDGAANVPASSPSPVPGAPASAPLAKSGTTATVTLATSTACAVRAGSNATLNELESTGADATAYQDKLPERGITGVDASEKMAETDREPVMRFKDAFVEAGNEYNLPPALLAAIASRETRGTDTHLVNGWAGNGFGLMQVDNQDGKRYVVTEGGPFGQPHINQATSILRENFDRVREQLPHLTEAEQLFTAVSQYNGGRHLSYPNSDVGTTHGDYANDVWARARYYAREEGWSTDAPIAQQKLPLPKWHEIAPFDTEQPPTDFPAPKWHEIAPFDTGEPATGSQVPAAGGSKTSGNGGGGGGGGAGVPDETSVSASHPSLVDTIYEIGGWALDALEAAPRDVVTRYCNRFDTFLEVKGAFGLIPIAIDVVETTQAVMEWHDGKVSAVFVAGRATNLVVDVLVTNNPVWALEKATWDISFAGGKWLAKETWESRVDQLYALSPSLWDDVLDDVHVPTWDEVYLTSSGFWDNILDFAAI